MNFLIVSLVVVALVGCSESASPPGTDKPVTSDGEQAWVRTGYDDLKPLGSKELPQLTREPPDPSKNQYERAAVQVVFGFPSGCKEKDGSD